jgi:hypothetical protein
MKKRKALLPLSAGLGFCWAGMWCTSWASAKWLVKWAPRREESTPESRGDCFIARLPHHAGHHIHARAAQVWPWRVLIGYGRAGWYSTTMEEPPEPATSWKANHPAHHSRAARTQDRRRHPGAPPPYRPFTSWISGGRDYLVSRCTLDMFSATSWEWATGGAITWNGPRLFFLHEDRSQHLPDGLRLRAEYRTRRSMGGHGARRYDRLNS